MLFTDGYNSKARTTASVKKDINPRPTPCFALKVSLYSFLRANIGPISTSLKVVNIAVVFLASTKRSATFLRNIESFVLDSPLALAPTDPIDGTALRASCFVIRPSLPVPETLVDAIDFSSKIFFAAGEGVPVA